MKGMKRKLAGLMAVCMIFTSLIPSFAETISMDEIPVIDSIEVVEEVEQVSTTEVGAYDEVSEEASVYGEATPSVPGGSRSVEYDGKKWMSYIPDDTLLGYLSIPGTHDSATSHIAFTDTAGLSYAIGELINNSIGNEVFAALVKEIEERLFKSFEKLIAVIITWIQDESGRCQDLTIEEQLEAGVRALDLRFRFDGGQWNLYHGCDNKGDVQSYFKTCVCRDSNGRQLTLPACFDVIGNFLKENPSEVVFLNIQNEGGEYNEEIERRLLELERRYGFSFYNANRDQSKKVLKNNFPDEKAPNRNPITPSDHSATLGDYRGKAVDITDAINKWSSWDETKQAAVTGFENNFGIRLFGNSYLLTEVQTNVMVKLYKLNDPYDECSLPFGIEWGYLWKVKVPVGFTVNPAKLIVSPRDQAEYVNPKVEGLLDSLTAMYPLRTTGTGILTMDFLTEETCYNIVRLSSRLPGGPNFTYTGKPHVTPLEPEEDEILRVDIEYTEEEIRSLFQKNSSSNDSDDDDEPLFTGTWNSAVKGGNWSQDSNGIWHYTSTEKFKNTWGYIQNPYAKEGQNTADWFWFDVHGNMLTGWQYINGKWYYLNPNKDGTLGACLIGPAITPDGYEVDASGAWTGK